MRRRFGLDIPETVGDVCDPATMALVVYDRQVGVVRQLQDGAETVVRVSRVLTAARSGGYPCGGRDRPAMQRALDSIGFSGDAMLTDIATIAPLLASASAR